MNLEKVKSGWRWISSAVSNLTLKSLARDTLIFVHIYVSILSASDFLFASETAPQIPIPGFRFPIDAALIRTFGGLSIALAVAALFRPKTRMLCLLSGLIAVPFVLVTSNHRLAFSYAPTLWMIFYGLSTISNSVRPALVGLIGVYWTAATQKFLNPERTRRWIEIDYASMAGHKMIQSLPFDHSILTTLLKYSAIPVEFTIGLLLSFQRTRFAGFVVAFCFHFIINLSVGANDLINIVMVVMLTQIMIVATFNSTETLGSTLKIPKKFISLCVSAALTALVVFSGPIPFLLGTLLKTFALGFAFLPFCLIQPEISKGQTTDLRAMVATIATVAVTIAWATLPWATHYQNRQMGFAMFTGNHENLPRYEFSYSRHTSCQPTHAPLPFFIREIETADRRYFTTVDHYALTRWRSFLIAKCAELNPDPITTKGTVREYIDSLPAQHSRK